ncbi:hypothetical protein EJ02DRAFT_450525, partial [Clathrospora elynae]
MEEQYGSDDRFYALSNVTKAASVDAVFNCTTPSFAFTFAFTLPTLWIPAAANLQL